ncbi:MAG TPA: phosphoglucomutase (alpha-D-glucose-1,6-bisphosphate-dependent) [Deltaproteobacteria bacterium]|nr:phosphoglucomutase (alpha-D-glucose-1,6-bisphosphate-dependent) [Deltaproteobacteria bacterium]HOM28337.1 phosphoglucomutase (alpha-D-glucose-1,6-bisphosphate-dependent) [Deltaproteobacteria bacterium]HPP79340.1 phosphoglucomutase (alpha-D-glucose-1,6-bisphosphate-dependent) [Deltaproteobacteria bacterium]
MAVHDLAGKPVPRSMLVDTASLVDAYYRTRPDPAHPGCRVSFGTSGHRGSSIAASFNEDHILAITQAICDYKREFGITGPVFVGRDTHALSEPAFKTAIEVLAANALTAMVDEDLGFTPTPSVSRAVIEYNRSRSSDPADGIVITPSHNGPEDGGFKYNPPEGGPADTKTTGWIEKRANALLEGRLAGVRRIPYERALSAPTTTRYDFTGPYVEGLASVIDMGSIASSGLRLCADALGGSGASYWHRIAERYALSIDVLHDTADATFGFMTLDHDGRIRMDCSSPYAMASLVALKDRYDLAFGNDPDFDRHGIVTGKAGLMNPNHFLAAAVVHLFSSRPSWLPSSGVGKTLVSSAMIDRAAELVRRELFETPVGFKWFVEPLIGGRVAFAGEESAGASLVCMDGSVWTTDKDGIAMALVAAEMLARTGKDPSDLYRELEERFGVYHYERIDVPAGPREKAALSGITPDMVEARVLAGDAVTAVLTRAPANGAAIGGIKVVTASGWFAARPSGTEDVYKIYAESFRGPDHLALIQEEARSLVSTVFGRQASTGGGA